MTIIQQLVEAKQLLQRGEVLAYPTEAVWGLGCDPWQQQAFEKILQLKQRPIEKGVILLSDSIDRIETLLTDLPLKTRQQVIHSWQTSDRPTTWLLPIHADIPPWIYGQHNQVAVRVTQHPLCRELCRIFDGLIVSTSANPAGLPPARTLAEVQHYFPNINILNGQLGHNSQPSRIIDAVSGQIIRD